MAQKQPGKGGYDMIMGSWDLDKHFDFSPDLSWNTWNKNDIRKRLRLGCHRGDTSQCLGRQTKPFWEKTTEKPI